MKNLEDKLRPEVEKWAMRAEELETRLMASIENHYKLTKRFGDAVKTVRIKDKQMSD